MADEPDTGRGRHGRRRGQRNGLAVDKSPRARWWILTIREADWQPPGQREDHAEEVDAPLVYIKGQLEQGAETDYRHWQLIANFERDVRLATVKHAFANSAHAEPTRSAAAADYVWKEDTRVAGTQFERGIAPVRRDSASDWRRVWQSAAAGDILAIPCHIRVCHYNNLRRISADYVRAPPIQRSCTVFWGVTGAGKSYRAWQAAGVSSYPKDPRSKWWCGYRDQKNVVIDEFRGGIDIGHILRWLDSYPVLVETKGSAVALVAESFWITSNLHPRDWYPDLDPATLAALLRRLNIVHLPFPFNANHE